jgi:DNA gyrase/topoisomerase IV subunit A
MIAVSLCRFDLAKAERRQHLVEGFLSALSRMDAVVAAIRAAPDGAAAARALCSDFKLSPDQARTPHAADVVAGLQTVLGLESLQELRSVCA